MHAVLKFALVTLNISVILGINGLLYTLYCYTKKLHCYTHEKMDVLASPIVHTLSAFL